MREFAEKPARQIDQMRTLVDKLSAARNRGVRAPFLIIADASAMPVATANKHQLAENSGRDEFFRFAQGPVVSMIEPHMNVHPLSVPGGEDWIEFRGEARGWLFDEDVLARIHGRKHDFGKRVVRRRNDDHVNGRIVSDDPPVRYGRSAGWTGKRLRPVEGKRPRKRSTRQPLAEPWRASDR